MEKRYSVMIKKTDWKLSEFVYDEETDEFYFNTKEKE